MANKRIVLGVIHSTVPINGLKTLYSKVFRLQRLVKVFFCVVVKKYIFNKVTVV